MSVKIISGSDIKRMVNERTNYFKAKIGNNVSSKNKENNNEYYNKAKKLSKLEDKASKEDNSYFDYNMNSLGLSPVEKPTDSYKRKVASQAKGYSSEMEEKNGSEKNGDFEGNKKFFNKMKDNYDEYYKEKQDLAHSGIQSSNYPKPEYETMYEGWNKKNLKFKHTKFISESSVLDKIPDLYKMDNTLIHMEDSEGNEYLVECVKNNLNNTIETKIVSYKNRKIMNEQVGRINELFGYNKKSTSSSLSYYDKVNESKSFNEMFKIARNI